MQFWQLQFELLWRPFGDHMLITSPILLPHPYINTISFPRPTPPDSETFSPYYTVTPSTPIHAASSYLSLQRRPPSHPHHGRRVPQTRNRQQKRGSRLRHGQAVLGPFVFAPCGFFMSYDSISPMQSVQPGLSHFNTTLCYFYYRIDSLAHLISPSSIIALSKSQYLVLAGWRSYFRTISISYAIECAALCCSDAVDFGGFRLGLSQKSLATSSLLFIKIRL